MRFLAAAAAVRSPAGTVDADCCVYVERIVHLMHGLPGPTAAQTALWRVYLDDDGQILPGHRWGPVKVASMLHVAEAAHYPDDGPRALPTWRWVLCQGWSSSGDGHTWAVKRVAEDTVIIVDSTRVTGARVRWSSWSALAHRYDVGIAWAVLRRAPR